MPVTSEFEMNTWDFSDNSSPKSDFPNLDLTLGDLGLSLGLDLDFEFELGLVNTENQRLIIFGFEEGV